MVEEGRSAGRIGQRRYLGGDAASTGDDVIEERTQLRFAGEITDYDALILAIKNEPEIREAVDKVVARIGRNEDAAVPAGMIRVEDKRAA